MNIKHTHYIKEMSDRTGETYRDLERLWRESEREFEFDQMKEPNRYSNLSIKKGTIGQEIARRFEDKVLKPETEENAETPTEEILPEEETFSEEEPFDMDFGDELEGLGEFDELEGELGATEEEPEAGLEDLGDEIEGEEEMPSEGTETPLEEESEEGSEESFDDLDALFSEDEPIEEMEERKTEKR